MLESFSEMSLAEETLTAIRSEEYITKSNYLLLDRERHIDILSKRLKSAYRGKNNELE